MKYALILGVALFTGVALAGEGEAWHNFSSGVNPHAEGGCASSKDKVAQFHKFHGKELNEVDSDKKVEDPQVKKEPKLEEFI